MSSNILLRVTSKLGKRLHPDNQLLARSSITHPVLASTFIQICQYGGRVFSSKLHIAQRCQYLCFHRCAPFTLWRTRPRLNSKPTGLSMTRDYEWYGLERLSDLILRFYNDIENPMGRSFPSGLWSPMCEGEYVCAHPTKPRPSTRLCRRRQICLCASQS